MRNKILHNLLGVNFYMNTLDFIARLYRSVFLQYKEDGIELIKYFLPENGTGIDIGANIGRFTRVLANLVGKNGLILSIEPLIYPRKILSSMLFILRFSQVRVFPNALSDKPSTAYMNIPLKNGKPQSALATLGATKFEDSMSEKVKIITLDSLIQKESLKELDFIKCDVEGLELEVFKGAEKTIKKFKPTIFCEVTENFYSTNGRSSSIFFELMRGYGYKIFFPHNGKLKALDKNNKLPKNVQDYFFIATNKIDTIEKKLFVK